MQSRQPIDLQASGLMVLLCMIWGIQQVVLKLAADDISPLMQIALRCGLSALFILPFLRAIPVKVLISSKYLLPGLWLSVLFAAEFLLVAEALKYTSASHTVVLLYTAPIFVALGLHWKFPSERLSRLQWGGIFLAFMGIVVAFIGRNQATATSSMLWGDSLALLAGIMWALTTISLRLSSLAEAPANQTLIYQLVGAFFLLMPLAYFTGQDQIHWTAMAIGSMVFHVFVMSLFSLVLWFWLLKNYLANHLGVFSFLTPIFGMVFGVWLLNEKIELNFIYGAVLVMLGVVCVSLKAWSTKR
jgi:drug/metabolite transporter (DMT)-like permease